MAAPTLTLTTSTSLSTAESVTSWTTFDTLDPDIVKEGSNSITGTFRADGTHGYFNNGSAPITAAGKTFRMWVNTTSVPYLDTAANGGAELSMFDGTTTEYYTVFSSDDYYGGWFQIVIDCDLFTTLTLANVEQWGFRMQYTSTAKNVDNCWVDALKYLDGYSMTGGTSGDEITLETIEVADRGTTTLYGYGVITVFGGVYYGTGNIQFGTGATTTWALLDGDILVFEDKPVAAGLYSLSGVGTGTRVTIQNSSTITSAGATDDTRFVFDWSDADLLTFSCTNSLIVRASTSTFKSGQTVTGNTFNDCGQVTGGGATLTGTTVKGYEGTSDTAGFIWNVATDPDGLTDDMVFEKGTASTHAIEFGLTSPLTMTLTGVTVSGYNAADSQTDSALYIARTSGTVTITLDNCTGTFSYKSAGAIVVIVSGAVSVQATAALKDGTPVETARVFLKASDATGPFPFEAAITSITRATTTATVTTTAAHGLASNDKIYLEGITDKTEDNWTVHQVTVTGTTTFTYTTTDSGSTAYTGTKKVTFVALNGTTNASGILATSRVYTSNQPVTGWTRKSTSSPFLQEGVLVGEVDSSLGFSGTAVMLADE